MNEFFSEAGACTRYHVYAHAHFCGADLSVTIGGGERSHIGAVSLAVYEPERDSATVSTVTVFSHRDDRISAHAAKRLSKALRCTVCVSAGVHIDDPSPAELEALLESCRACLDALESELSRAQS